MIALLSAPSNLGLRPPRSGATPGTAKAPEALREAGLYSRFVARGATDAGVVLHGRYVDDDHIRPSGLIRNQVAIIDHARRLERRITTLREENKTPFVIGGDCSLLIGAGLANRTAPVGLIHLDGHLDFRHPGNSADYGSLAGEDLAAAIGRHLPDVANIDGLGPYFDPAATVHIGCRDDADHLDEARAVLAEVITARDVIEQGSQSIAQRVAHIAGLADGYWLHVDVDVLDPACMPAVDSPDPGGLTSNQLVQLLQTLAPHAIGATVTIFDPDLDPDGQHARTLTNVLDTGLHELGAAHSRHT